MIYFIAHSDIQSEALELIIADELSKADNYIYLTATQNLKKMRADSPFLSQRFVPYKNNDNLANLYSITDFIQYSSKKTYESKEYLSNADQKYVLSKVINFFYKENPIMKKTMYQMRYDLYDLFSLLAFHDKNISKKHLTAINEDFSIVENDIFNIYAIFQAVIAKIIIFIAYGQNDTLLVNILGDNFLKSTKPKTLKNFTDKQKEVIDELISKTDSLFLDGFLFPSELENSLFDDKENKLISLFYDKQKEIIDNFISKTNALVFDGFLFFNEMQNFILSAALRQNKSVYFISKQFTDDTGNFMFERSINEIAKKMSVEIKTIKIPAEKTIKHSALDYIRSMFPLSVGDIPPNAKELISDGTIQFIRPFISREGELRYVAKSISKRLKEAYKGDINEIIRMLNNDIAIVLAIDKENYEERISNIFREVGFFVFKTELTEGSDYKDIDTNSFAQVYFMRQDFLDSDIKRTSGESLNYQDKHILFERCFMRIDINRNTRPIASYPVGQFILELYRTICEGMSIEGFKGILYSNWRYTVDKVQLKWSDFISDFKYIEIFFEKSTSLSEWCSIADELASLKEGITDNPLYEYHPLHQIKTDSLKFFCDLLGEMQELSNKINSVIGSIDSHLNTLKTVVMQAGNIIGADDDNLEFEQIILKKLALAIGDMGASSMMANLDSNYFAQNIRAMLTDWEQQNTTETENTMRLNAVNLENMKKYKCCYFIMCESDKYPRRYFDRFPFTADIIEILENPKYGIEVTPHEIRGLEYHLELERYLFKNVLDFTTGQLIFTYSEKENGNYNKPSIFTVDVATAFGVDIPYTEQDISTDSAAPKFTQDTQSRYIAKKTEYTLTELAIFKLCPKLYYHRQTDGNAGVYLNRLQLKFYMEAILYCDLLRRFMGYNLDNKKVYRKNAHEHEDIIANLFKESCAANAKYFSFFTQYEIEDAIRNVSGKVKGFIENAMKNLKGSTYTVITYQNKHYTGNGYELVIEHDNRVVDYDLKKWRMSQNSTYLEFLVLKTSSNKSEITHYADMIKALDENNPNEDRINLISRVIAKINIQFDSKRYAHDGIKRTDELVQHVCNYDFSKAAVMESEYCTYCRLNDICMGR